MASFMMGQISTGAPYGSTYEIQFEPATQSFQYAGYVQDNWKMTPNLTLNLGLRYDVNTPRTERYNRMNWFDPDAVSPTKRRQHYVSPIRSAGNTSDPAAARRRGVCQPDIRTNWVTDWKDIQPRFGFSFHLTRKPCPRRLRHLLQPDALWRQRPVELRLPRLQPVQQPGSHLSERWRDALSAPDNPFPNGLQLPTGNSLGLPNDVGYGAIGPIRDSFYARTPSEQSWSLGVQRQLARNMVFTVDYVGKKGTHLYYQGLNTLDILGPYRSRTTRQLR